MRSNHTNEGTYKISRGNLLLNKQYGTNSETWQQSWNFHHHLYYPKKSQLQSCHWQRNQAASERGPIFPGWHDDYIRDSHKPLSMTTSAWTFCTNDGVTFASLRTHLFQEREEVKCTVEQKRQKTNTHCTEPNNEQSDRWESQMRFTVRWSSSIGNGNSCSRLGHKSLLIEFYSVHREGSITSSLYLWWARSSSKMVSSMPKANRRIGKLLPYISNKKRGPRPSTVYHLGTMSENETATKIDQTMQKMVNETWPRETLAPYASGEWIKISFQDIMGNKILTPVYLDFWINIEHQQLSLCKELLKHLSQFDHLKSANKQNLDTSINVVTNRGTTTSPAPPSLFPATHFRIPFTLERYVPQGHAITIHPHCGELSPVKIGTILTNEVAYCKHRICSSISRETNRPCHARACTATRHRCQHKRKRNKGMQNGTG